MFETLLLVVRGGLSQDGTDSGLTSNGSCCQAHLALTLSSAVLQVDPHLPISSSSAPHLPTVAVPYASIWASFLSQSIRGSPSEVSTTSRRDSFPYNLIKDQLNVGAFIVCLDHPGLLYAPISIALKDVFNLLCLEL